jgi:superfamily II DNA or RNA helicase
MGPGRDDSEVFADLAFRFTWRPSQARVLEAIRLHLNDDRLHVVAAPGAGKTTLGLECFRLLAEPALVLSPTRTIRDQWVSRLRDFVPPDAAFPPEWVSTSLDAPSVFTSITYQALHTKQRLADEANEAANEGEDEEEDSPLDEDEVSILAEIIQAAGIRTLILDEAHHLRAEWWSALSRLVAGVDEMKVVSLTATPPYDAQPAEWTRYEELCGTIDEEISVPELVKAETLCPHQDYIWTVTPIESEAQALADYEDGVETIITEVSSAPTFIADLAQHGWLTTSLTADDVLSDLEVAFSLLAISNHVGAGDPLPLAASLDERMEEVAPPTVGDWQCVIRSYLFDKTWPRSESSDAARKLLAQRLRRESLLHGRELRLATSRLAKRNLTQSAAKIAGVLSIYAVEHASRGEDLRMVVLTDYIRDHVLEDLDSTEPDALGAVPIFRAVAEGFPGTGHEAFALLTGRVSFIHESRWGALASTDRGEQLDRSSGPTLPGYIRVTATNTGDLTSAMTELLDRGEIQLLVGTRSLLGEGWDAPCVNALVLASSVGSFMLTNQMRGRAIRVHRDQPDKIASIWHIVAFALDRPRSPLARSLRPVQIYEPGLADFVELRQRFRTFVGLNRGENRIENGILRVPLRYTESKLDRITGVDQLQLDIKSFSSREALEKANASMVSYRGQIDAVADGWRAAIESATLGRVVPEVKTTNPPRFAAFHLRHTLGYLVAIAAAIFTTVLLLAVNVINGAGAVGLVGLVIVASLLAAWPLAKAARLALRHLPIDGTVHEIGNALVDALCAADLIETSRRKLEVRSNSTPMKGAVISLDGGTYYERSLFADAIGELLGEIDNPRYLLVRTGKTLIGQPQVDYHTVPRALAVRKERAELLAMAWERRVGPTELLYARGPEAKATLLKARARSFANAARETTSRLERWV